MTRTSRSTQTVRNFKCVNHWDGTFTVTWTDDTGGHTVTGGDAETGALCQRLVKSILADTVFAK